MLVERIHAHPHVRSEVGRVSLKRGPLVYCVEEIDHPSTPVASIRLPRGAATSVVPRPDLLSGIVTIVADAVRVVASDGELYRADP